MRREGKARELGQGLGIGAFGKLQTQTGMRMVDKGEAKRGWPN